MNLIALNSGLMTYRPFVFYTSTLSDLLTRQYANIALARACEITLRQYKSCFASSDPDFDYDLDFDLSINADIDPATCVHASISKREHQRIIRRTRRKLAYAERLITRFGMAKISRHIRWR